MNLIEQQNILRGLADNALQGEMQSGTVPPYLVLAEINRRKTARERYEAAVAKRGGNQTVAEELLGKRPMQGINGIIDNLARPMPQPEQAGIDAAMSQEQPAFADGGMVGYADGGLADLVSAYNQRLSGMDKDREMAQKMALMQIGAQIMAGRSRNTLSNVGSGLAAALPGYQQSMERLNVQEMQGLRDQIDLARQMEQDRLAAEDREFNRERAERSDELALIPSWAQDDAMIEEIAKTDPERAAKLRQQKADLNSKAEADAKAKRADEIISSIAKQYEPIPVMSKEGMVFGEADVAKARLMQEQDRANRTYTALLAEGLDDEADAFMKRMNLSVTAGGNPDDPLAGATDDDPLGVRAGSYGVVMPEPSNMYGQGNPPFWQR